MERRFEHEYGGPPRDGHGGGDQNRKVESESQTPIQEWVEGVNRKISYGEAHAFVEARDNVDVGEDELTN